MANAKRDDITGEYYVSPEKEPELKLLVLAEEVVEGDDLTSSRTEKVYCEQDMSPNTIKKLQEFISKLKTGITQEHVQKKKGHKWGDAARERQAAKMRILTGFAKELKQENPDIPWHECVKKSRWKYKEALKEQGKKALEKDNEAMERWRNEESIEPKKEKNACLACGNDLKDEEDKLCYACENA